MKYRMLMLLLVIAALLIEGYAFYTVLNKRTTEVVQDVVAKNDSAPDR